MKAQQPVSGDALQHATQTMVNKALIECVPFDLDYPFEVRIPPEVFEIKRNESSEAFLSLLETSVIDAVYATGLRVLHVNPSKTVYTFQKHGIVD